MASGKPGGLTFYRSTRFSTVYRATSRSSTTFIIKMITSTHRHYDTVLQLLICLAQAVGMQAAVGSIGNRLDNLFTDDHVNFDGTSASIGMFSVTIRVFIGLAVIRTQSHFDKLSKMILPEIKVFSGHCRNTCPLKKSKTRRICFTRLLKIQPEIRKDGISGW